MSIRITALVAWVMKMRPLKSVFSVRYGREALW
jgi:hypothetical protein